MLGRRTDTAASSTLSRLFCDSSELCCTDHSQHEITIAGSTRATQCFLDTLLLVNMMMPGRIVPLGRRG
jgi:hypothetical protein